jgi:hypothetical protein
MEQGSLEKLPDTVQATVLARLDLLPRDERRVLQVGSVFGRSFRPAGIAAIEPSLANVDDLCDSVTAKDLVRPGEGESCVFRHILIREVAYQTLPRAERMRLHAAAAEWLEARAAGREVALGEIIAYHYREAALLGTSIDPDAERTLELRRRAVRWLVAAADVAQAAAALPEAVRHLRAAVELAEESATGILHERIGECMGSDDGVAEFQHALQLYRKYGAPPEDQLRALAGLLMISTRMQGSLAERLSDALMEELRAEGRRLSALTSDRRAIARFQAADAFYPFWLQLKEVPSQVVVDEADSQAREALLVARELGDNNLASIALDALSGNATAQADYAGTREYSRQRLEFEDRLNLYERIDAHSMMAWMNSILGDLKEAVDSSSRGMGVIQPGQVPASVLHLIAWRLYALTHLGRWDEVLALAPRQIQLWEEVGRIAAGYTLRGTVASWLVARARREPLALELAAMIRGICAKFDDDNPNRPLLELVEGDLDAGLRQLRDTGRARYAPEIRELILGVLNDAGAEPPAEVIDGLLREWAGKVPLTEAQALRARGLLLHDPAALAQSEDLYAAMGEVPMLARVRVELGRMTGDSEKIAAGERVLEGLRDVEYLGRHAHA